MTGYILDLNEDENGDLFIVFPPELVDELGWQEGDLLNWDLKGDGVVISRVHDSYDYEEISE
jgi:hypothetical protein